MAELYIKTSLIYLMFGNRQAILRADRVLRSIVMRWKAFIGAALGALVFAISVPQSASAFGHRDRAPDGWGKTRAIKHWVYYPRYVHHYKVDPYAYQYSPRGYYPYYGSRYWRPASVIRKRKHAHYHHWNVQPPRYRFYPSWGYPRHWHHRAWHKAHHGYHHRWHW